jgi:osmotically-inducible protein OsmY
MSRETLTKLDAALQQVKSSRRDLLKRLLVGSGTMALMTPMTNLLAAGKSNSAISNCLAKKGVGAPDGPYPGAIATVTDKGVVKLTGSLKMPSESEALTTLAQNCGATNVNNRIKVGKSKPKTPSSTSPPAK